MYRYYYSKDGLLRYRRHHVACSEATCSLCEEMRHFASQVMPTIEQENPAEHKMLKGLVSGNLKRHLASGKHWHYTDGIRHIKVDGVWMEDGR